MNKLLFAILLVLFGCSNDDNSVVSEQEEQNPLENLVVNAFGNAESSQQVFQMEIDVETEVITNTNLTQTIGLPFSRTLASSDNNIITWYEAINANFNTWQKNLTSGATQTTSAPCSIENENLQAVTNTENELVYITRFFGSDTESAKSKVRVYSQGATCSLQEIESFAIQNFVTTEDAIFLYAFDIFDNENVKVFKISTQTGQIQGEITLPASAKLTLIQDVIHSFNFNGTYTTYSTNTLQLIETKNLGIINADGFGFFDGQIFQNVLLSSIVYAQPSPFVKGPILVDLTTGELASSSGILFEIQQNLRNEPSYSGVQLITYEVDIEKGLILCSFTNFGGTQGIAFTNFDAEILKIINTEYLAREMRIAP